MPTTTTRWYQTTVGLLVAGLLGAVLATFVGFIVLTLRYTWLIKHGSGDQIMNKVQEAFTSLSAASGVATTQINRSDLEVSTAPALGSQNAPITIVEFVDFKCPNCKLAAPILQQVASTYGKDVKILIRNFPIESLHPGASRLALFAECANEQGVFWPTYNILYTRQDSISAELSDQEIAGLGTTLLLDQTRLSACMNSPKTASIITKDYAAALQYGVRGTPTFFVNGAKWEGVMSFDTWKHYIESNK